MSRPKSSRVEKVAAQLTIRHIPGMTGGGRKAICAWLRKLARDINSGPDSFADTFTARYLYRE